MSHSVSEVVIGDVVSEIMLCCQRVHAATVTWRGRVSDSDSRLKNQPPTWFLMALTWFLMVLT